MSVDTLATENSTTRFKKLKTGVGRPLGTDALPLLSNEEVFVDIHAVIKRNAVVELKAGLIFI